MREITPHWLAPAGKTKTPRVLITFDTETTEEVFDHHTVQRLRCWGALVRTRSSVPATSDQHSYHQGTTAVTLTDLIEATTETCSEVWVMAHNVGFDLSVTSLPFVLNHRGWTVDALHLGDESSWWVMKHGAKKIVITDSWSWLRCPLSEAAKDIGRRKVKLPSETDSLEQWQRRCKRDVEILDEVMATILDWWDANNLGVFGITGAACGWRTLRRKVPAKRVLVGPEEPRTSFERLAVYGGRKEVYGVGEFHDTWIADYDFVGAYPTVAAAYQLPTMPAKPWCPTGALLDGNPPAGRDYIAEVEITTRVPCAPVRVGPEIWWPVGTFRTVLAGPEVRYAASVAESVTVLRYQAYKVNYALADWAGWCLKIQTADPKDVPAVVARVAKGWGRSVIGRFAARSSHVVATRPAVHLGWHLETGHDLDTGAALEWLSMGGIEQTIAKDLDGADCFPAVLAFVESHTRVGLATTLATRDPTALLQCNTDGWWEARQSNRSTYVPENVPWPFTVVRKALERNLVVRGPNHVMTPHERRYAGIPRKADDNGGQNFKWYDWPGLRWQLEHGETGTYHRPEKFAVLSEHYVRRWVLDTGETIPVTCSVDSDGFTSVLPWSQSWGRLEDDTLAPYQVPSLSYLQRSDIDPQHRVHVMLPTQPGRGFVTQPRSLEPPKPRASKPRRRPSDRQSEPLIHVATK